MHPTAKLGLYLVVLAAVLVASLVAGGAVDPVGLANAEPEAGTHGEPAGDAGLPGLAAAEGGLRLVAETATVPAGSGARYAFRIEDGDGPVTDFDVEHGKRMHLIAVRRDLVGFVHEHPTMADDGTWSGTLRLDEPGTYRVFADFVVSGDRHTLGTDLFVPGDFTPAETGGPREIAGAGDGYEVVLDAEPVAGRESTLRFTVRRDGEAVDDLEPYLGARGHLVALRAGDLAYLHVHADEEELAFDVELPTPGRYRLFLQLRHGGAVRTAAFTIDATETTR
jgi:hypothetical protein